MSENSWRQDNSNWDTDRHWKRMKEDQRAVREGKKKYVPKMYNRGDAGKGDARRDIDISDEEYGLKYDLAFGKITREEFDKRMSELDNTMG